MVALFPLNYLSEKIDVVLWVLVFFLPLQNNLSFVFYPFFVQR